MSSSVFIEKTSLATDATDCSNTSDSNLVVVYGKNGISFDDKGLENLMEEKKISSISVIRLTSPTPSMQEEENETEKLEELLRRHEIGSDNDSSGSEDEDKNSYDEDSENNDSSNDEDNEERKSSKESDNDSSDGDKSKQKIQTRRRGRQPNLTKQKKSTRKQKRERPEIVGLRLEEFYPSEDANEIIKEALKIAGLKMDKRSKSDYDFQLFVIQNDHCYTPFTSPAQMKAKLAADKIEAEKVAANRKSSVLQSTVVGKQIFVRKKLQQNISLKAESIVKINTPSTSAKEKGIIIAYKSKKDIQGKKALQDEVKNDNDGRSSIGDNEDDEDGEDEIDLSGTDISAESDNDRDSDLDFDVNNPKGRKPKTKLLKTQKRPTSIVKTNLKSKRFYTTDELVEPTSKPNITPTVSTYSPSTPVQRQKSFVKIISDPMRFTIRSAPSKISHMMGQTNVLSPVIAALPPIPKKQNQNKPLVNTTSGPTPIAMPSKAFVVVKNPMEHKIATQSSPQTHKEIVINKHIMSSPKTKGFTDLTKLIEQTEKQTPPPAKPIGPPTTPKSSRTAIITSVVTFPPTSTAVAPLKGFMPIETAAKNQLPAQISIQSHQSSSELEAEHDKLDLINSIVQSEMEKPNEKPEEQIRNISENIPELVKMLESTEKVLVSTNSQQSNVPKVQQNINHHINVSSNSNIDNKCITNNQNITNTTSISSSSANNIVGDIDITSASLLATPEGDGEGGDDLPDDILQQVVDLIKDDKTLQEAVEKQVFGTDVCDDQGIINNIMTNQNPPPLAPISQQHIKLQEQSQNPSKSIIQLAISNVPTSLDSSPSCIIPNPVITTSKSTNQPTNVTTVQSPTQTLKPSPSIRKEPIQIVRGNGRVITLPPIEAPTTRAKRRAQAQPNTNTTSSGNSSFISPSVLSESSLDSSMTTVSSSSTVLPQDKKITDTHSRRRGSKENNTTTTTIANQKATKTQRAATKKGGSKANINKGKVEAEATESEEDDDDDPNKLWCICRQPHNNRFMICCDVCEDWFHGTCVSITKAMGLEMEQKGIDWTCPKCLKKQEEKKQPKITELLIKKPTETNPAQNNPVVNPPIVTPVLAPMTIQKMPIPKVTSVNTDLAPKMEPSSKKLETVSHIKLQSGQIINLKDFSAAGAKRATIIQTSTANTGTLTAGQKKLYVASGQANLKITSQPGTPIRTITVVKPLTTTHTNIKVIKSLPSATATTSQSSNVGLTSFTTSGVASVTSLPPITPSIPSSTESSTLCIVCKKIARSNSIYCSDDCIRKHAQNALNTIMNKSQSDNNPTTCLLNKSITEDKTKRKSKGLFEELLSAADRKPKVERVNVYERKSGRVITGNSAPTVVNLKKWLQDNPTFEVIQPGSTQALDLEKKQKLRILNSSSPTVLKSSTFSPPPLKIFSVTSNITGNKVDSGVGSSSSVANSLQVQMKTYKNITEYLKCTSSQSTSPRPTTPKQLQKYPQQVIIKPDRVPKSPEDSKAVVKEKPLATKRQMSTENSVKSSSNDGEPIRLVVRRTLKEQLLLRIKEETALMSIEERSKGNTVPKLTEEEIEDFAKSTELEMYNYFNRDTGIKYKAKYRSLVFNIKDRKNHTLYAKICRKLIEPKQLVRMSPEEMASQELAQWREQENKHQLEMIKKSELDLLACAKNYVLKTHKGEEVIEGKSSDYANVDITIPVEDVVSAINKSDLQGSSPLLRKDMQTHRSNAETALSHSHSLLPETLHLSIDEDASKLKGSQPQENDKEREKDKEKEREKEKERDKEREKEKDPDKEKDTERKDKEKERDREKEREKIRNRDRDRDRDKGRKSKDRHHEKLRSRKRSRSHSRSRSREKSDKRHKSSHKDDKRVRDERIRVDKEYSKDRYEREYLNQESEKKLSSSTEAKKYSIQSRQPGKKFQEQQKVTISPLETYNLIDQILESTKTVEEAANLISDRDKEKETESQTQRKGVVTPQPVQSATSTVSTSSGGTDSGIAVDVPSNMALTESDQEPTSTVSIPTPPHDPYSRFIACSSPSTFSSDLQYKIISLWTGNINMVDVTSFQLSIQPIVGNSSCLAKLLPKELDVVGRIGPETVWDYISKIKKSPNKEICVIRLIPANESETVAYKILYEYLDNRNRLGVIKSTSSQIKDFYIYPLGASKNVPKMLQPNETVEFYDDPYRPDVLIGILVRVVGSKRSIQNSSQSVLGTTSTSSALNKVSNRSTDKDTFTPPGSPKPKKRRQSNVHSVAEIDIDAIIKAPIAAKAKKAVASATLPIISDNDADEPYSPGGSSDDDLPVLPIKLPTNTENIQSAEDELKRKMEEINRQIAAQEMEIAGLLTGEPTTFGSSTPSTSNVLANISIPSNLSQILASIKTTGKDQSVVPPPPPLIGSLIKSSSSTSVTSTSSNKEYNTENKLGSAYETKDTSTVSNTNSTSLLAKLSEAELLSMVPDDIALAPSKPTRYEEPPPPGV